MEKIENIAGQHETNHDLLAEQAGLRSKELAKDKAGETTTETVRAIDDERSRIEGLFSSETSPTERKKAHIDGLVVSRKASPRPGSGQQRDISYNHTMEHVTSEMSAVERRFSKFIHAPAVERTSEAVGATIARPNAILAGSIMAFILVSLVYVVSRNMGYTLSGFETIGAFALGWIIGLIYDYARITITGRSL